MATLASYRWPGNVRELRNVCERLSLLGGGEEIGEEDLRRCGLGPELPGASEVWLPEKAQQFSDALGLGFCSEPSLFTMGDRQHRVPGRLEWCQENWYYTIGDSDVH